MVGPCASGKSTLVPELEKYGYQARSIAQEHSFVQDMWLRITNPEALIYLDVSYKVAMERRPQTYNAEEFQDLNQRLSHALSHADFYLHTDELSPGEVAQAVLVYLVNYRSAQEILRILSGA